MISLPDGWRESRRFGQSHRIINVPVRESEKQTTDASVRPLRGGERPSLWEGAIGIAVQGAAHARPNPSQGSKPFTEMMTDFVEAAPGAVDTGVLEAHREYAKYWEMLQEEGTEESESRIENIRELLTAAVESAEAHGVPSRFSRSRGAGVRSGCLRRRGAHHADDTATREGLEFPVVFNHGTSRTACSRTSRSIDEAATWRKSAAVLCGMTRAEQKLYLTSASIPPLFRQHGSAGLGALAFLFRDPSGSV
jgi:DNA helicase-2/ATP-dependent DNA helicase PcrA